MNKSELLYTRIKEFIKNHGVIDIDDLNSIYNTVIDEKYYDERLLNYEKALLIDENRMLKKNIKLLSIELCKQQ